MIAPSEEIKRALYADAEKSCWSQIRIAHPGQIVRHNDAIWILEYDRPVTQLGITEPGNEEHQPMWRQLDAHQWRDSPIPKVRRRGWRKKAFTRFIDLAERIERSQRTKYARVRLGQATLGQFDAASWLPQSIHSDEERLRRKLGLSCADRREVLNKRQSRAVKRSTPTT